MKRTLIAALVLSCSVARAGDYRCPPTYPGKDAPADPLTNAYMMWGKRPSSGPPFPSGWDHPDERAAAEGTDLRYELPANEEGWFICEYGSRKRIKGRFHGGHEWGQHMAPLGEQPWFIKVSPNDTRCVVRIREIKGCDPGKSTWTVTATCL
ncbi:hypothetical protein [Massilia sp. Root335]|uniref:hypothetical protein n=1 Tax=Massilia sp. Root335 TaxID=1736517 RepID=UPI0007135EA5|nr:hypothetical protein [Massilia sp. Root335]KQV52252.1 hypothetical protein ASC93_06495 [Massilia sp. Root335]